LKDKIDINLKIEVESLFGKLGIDYVYDPELLGWLFREKNHIIFMSVVEIIDDRLLSFFVKLGEFPEDYTSEQLYTLLSYNMKSAFVSFAINGRSIYMKYVTQIKELDSEEFLIALKVVSFNIEKCANIVKKLIETP